MQTYTELRATWERTTIAIDTGTLVAWADEYSSTADNYEPDLRRTFLLLSRALYSIVRARRVTNAAKHAASSFGGHEMPGYDFSQPIAKRRTGYVWRVPKVDEEPRTSRGFYLASSLARGSHAPLCDARGSSFSLRLDWANVFLSGRLAETRGYFADDDAAETFKPIVARLPNRRGFLAGWTLGEGMASTLFLSTVFTDAADAARAAHDYAERDAEFERDYQERERAKLAEEERAEDARKLAANDKTTLEKLVDTWGLESVLVMLSEVCGAKAAHLEEAWQDKHSARAWSTLSRRVDRLADEARARGLTHND